MPTHLPSSFLKSLQGTTGFDEAAFIQIHESAGQVTSIRLNPLKTTVATNLLPEQSVIPWCGTGRYLAERPSFTFDPVFHGGAYYVQEASSMFIDHILKHIYKQNPQPKRVLDLCAAPGGKSTLLSAALPDSFIVSNEVIKTRVSILAENIAKWGSENVFVTSNDPKDFQKLPGYFDLMVIDAPCSGSGLFRKDSNAIGEWSEANVQMCSLRQQRIISDTVGSLQQNGHLIYSTCSYSSQEDESVCDWIVEQFGLEPVAIPLDDIWGVINTRSEKYAVPGYRFFPDKVEGEGFFVACFRQPVLVDEYYGYSTTLTPISKKDKQLVETFIPQIDDYVLTGYKEIIIASPKKWESEIATIHKTLNLRKSGIAVGEIKGKDFIPHHELALSHLLSTDIPFANLDKATALHYLRRQDFATEISLKGWTLCRYEDINLGWMKVLPNRVNNYYPVNWRILKR